MHTTTDAAEQLGPHGSAEAALVRETEHQG